MEEQRVDRSNVLDGANPVAPNFTRPVWEDEQMTCSQCRYNDQDVDTFPCAKCHTRN